MGERISHEVWIFAKINRNGFTLEDLATILNLAEIEAESHLQELVSRRLLRLDRIGPVALYSLPN